MRIYQFILLSSLVLMTRPALSCSEEVQDLYWTYDVMVWRTDSIVLAKVSNIEQEVIGRENIFRNVEFDVLEVLKGSKKPEKIFLKGLSPKNIQTDYNKHNDLKFWGRSTEGNARYFPDCKTYGHYEIGNTYLIYSDITNTKGYERIIDLENDKWLNLTRYIINSK